MLSRQHGLGTVEALAALVVLSFSLMGLGHFMVRQLAETRAGNARALAIRHAEAIRASLALQRQVLESPGPIQWSGLDEQLGQLAAALPGATAQLWRSPQDDRQVGIAITWPGAQPATAPQAALAPTAAETGFDCPARRLCHVLYAHY